MNYVENFRALLLKWPGAYVSASYSYFGLKTSHGLQLLHGKINLHPTPPEKTEPRFQAKTKHSVVGKFVRKIAENEIVTMVSKAAESGELNGLEGFSPLVEDSGGFLPYLSVATYPFSLPLTIRGVSRHTLQCTLNLFPDFDSEIKTADIPFDTFDALLNHCGLPVLSKMGDLTDIQIIAESPGIISPLSTVTDENVTFHCSISKALDVKKLKIGFRIVWNNQSEEPGHIRGTEFHWDETEWLKLGTHRVSIKNAIELRVFLSYDEQLLDQRTFRNPKWNVNVRHEIQQTFDPQLVLLKKLLLEPNPQKADSFEYAVSSLFTLLGYSTSNFCRIPKLQDGPDIVAFSPSGRLAIIECTVGRLDHKGKLAKLMHRTTNIRDRLTSIRQETAKIQPVIVTALTRDEVHTELDQAAKYGIAVICKAELEGFLGQASLPPNADRLFEEMTKMIPVVNSGSLYGL